MPVWVPKRIKAASRPKRYRHNCPMFSSSRTVPISVWRASPICELCAQITALAFVPRESKRGYGEDNLSTGSSFRRTVRWEGRAARNVMLRPRGSSGTKTSPLS